MDNNIIYVLVAGLLALIFSFWKTSWIEKQDQGTKKMVVIGSSIADGAMAFLRAEYRVLSVFVIAVAIILGVANKNNPESSVFIAFSFSNWCSGVWLSWVPWYEGCNQIKQQDH